MDKKNENPQENTVAAISKQEIKSKLQNGPQLKQVLSYVANTASDIALRKSFMEATLKADADAKAYSLREFEAFAKPTALKIHPTHEARIALSKNLENPRNLNKKIS